MLLWCSCGTAVAHLSAVFSPVLTRRTWCGAGDLFLDSGTARVIDVAFSPAGIAQASVAYKTFRLKREEGYLLADDRAKQAFATAAEQGFENWHGFNPESERGEYSPLLCLLLLPCACLSRYHGVCW